MTRWPVEPLTFSKKNPSRAIPRSTYIHPPSLAKIGQRTSEEIGNKQTDRQTDKQTNAARFIVWYAQCRSYGCHLLSYLHSAINQEEEKLLLNQHFHGSMITACQVSNCIYMGQQLQHMHSYPFLSLHILFCLHLKWQPKCLADCCTDRFHLLGRRKMFYLGQVLFTLAVFDKQQNKPVHSMKILSFHC